MGFLSLSETEKEKLVDLMAEIDKVDIDVDAIKTQAGELSNRKRPCYFSINIFYTSRN